MKKIVILSTISLFFQLSYAQNVGIGTTTPTGSALLDLQSTEKGFLLPRMTTQQRNSIASPAIGLLVFDTNKGAIYMFDGKEWLPLSASNTLSMQSRGSNFPAPNTGFGWKCCISGNYAAISSNASTTNGGNYIDTVFVFFKNNGNWTLMSKLVQNDPVSGDGFGRAVAISGDYILVGAPSRNGQTGAIYAYARQGQTWTQTAIIIPAIPQSGSRFGDAISMDGPFAMVGAPFYNTSPAVARGSVFCFSRNISTWQEMQQIWGISTLEGFGRSIDISGTYALVGAPESDPNGMDNSGIAYFFKRSGSFWQPADTIYNTNGQAGDEFGYAVAINESTNWAFISRPYHTTYNNNTGDVRTYTVIPQGFVHWGTIVNPTYSSTVFKLFGYSLSVYNNNLLIGVPGANNEIGARGRVYIYKYDGTYPNHEDRWQAWKILRDENYVPQQWGWDAYGYSVSIGGYDIVIGNPGANHFQGKALFVNIE